MKIIAKRNGVDSKIFGNDGNELQTFVREATVKMEAGSMTIAYADIYVEEMIYEGEVKFFLNGDPSKEVELIKLKNGETINFK